MSYDSSDLIFFSKNYVFCIKTFNASFNSAFVFLVVFIISFFSPHSIAFPSELIFFPSKFLLSFKEMCFKKKILLNMQRSFKIFSFGFSSK